MEIIKQLEELLAEIWRKLEAVEIRTKKLEKILRAKGIPEKELEKICVQPKRNK